MQKTKFHTEEVKQQQKKRQKEDDERQRQEEIDNARSGFDEGEDDNEEEKRCRSEARKYLMKFNGDVWSVARDGNVEMMRRYFLVNGATKLLSCHDFNQGQGGRTLLHVACWYSYMILVLRNLIFF